jgi:hypothetical protein
MAGSMAVAAVVALVGLKRGLQEERAEAPIDVDGVGVVMEADIAVRAPGLSDGP